MTNTLTAEHVAKQLGAARRAGRGFTARCPVHDDKSPSLSITDAEDGKLLVYCHAGCDQHSVIMALQRLGLWPAQPEPAPIPPKRKIVATYDYIDPERGELRMQVLRYQPKDFRQRRPDGNGGWAWNVGPEHRLLYNLVAVANCSDIVCLVEGEKDVDQLSALGIVATCNPGGAGKWDARYSEFLRDKDICIIPDNDAAGESHATVVASHLAGVARSIRLLRLPGLPDKGDVSDFLANGGSAEELKHLISTAPMMPVEETARIAGRTTAHRAAFRLEIGSDVEMATRLVEIVSGASGPLVFAENAFWTFSGTHWRKISDEEMRLACHRFDGATYLSRSGNPLTIKLNKARLDSILNECAFLCSQPTFFANPACGINCASGFIRFDDDGVASLEGHDPEHRCRHILPGHWSPSSDFHMPPDSLLSRLLTGTFMGDEDAEEKVHLLAQLAGAAALGYATKIKQPRAVIFHGLTAENGKSQILDVLRGLLPASAVCSIAVARMTDERHVVGLAGKLLNASDELSGDAVSSHVFKAVITGEPVEGRDVFKSRVEFRPHAQHVFATNVLPPFKGGIDRGIQRRLLVIPFKRTIPLNERVEGIGRRIPVEEADLLLAWAVAGASDVVRNRNFVAPPSCAGAMSNWMHDADPVLAWLKECTFAVDAADDPGMASRFAYNAFVRWAVEEGFNRNRLPSINVFTQRVMAYYPDARSARTNSCRMLRGFTIKPYDSAVYAEW